MPKFGVERGGSAPAEFGATVLADGVAFAVHSRHAERIEVCLFDAAGETELARLPLLSRDGDTHHGRITGIGIGTRYGLRAHGPFRPELGHRFDLAKLLIDPYARRLDRPFAWHPDLALPPDRAVDTAALVPKAIVEVGQKQPAPFARVAPRLIYELPVRAFSMRHPDIQNEQRGTLAALTHPKLLDHLKRIGVDTVELMPLQAWIDERHLPPLGLSNAWGYNPLTLFALDPRLAPGGLADLRNAVAALHAAGMQVVLDIVLNHSGESDEAGATLSFREIGRASCRERVCLAV